MKTLKTPLIMFSCRFHPTDWWHELGCDHRDWPAEDLKRAMTSLKKSKEMITNHDALGIEQKEELLENARKKFVYLRQKLLLTKKGMSWDD